MILGAGGVRGSVSDKGRSGSGSGAGKTPPSISPRFNAPTHRAKLPPSMLSINSIPSAVVVSSLNSPYNNSHCIFAISFCLLFSEGRIKIVQVSIGDETHREVKPEKNSVAIFAAVSLDRMSLNARLRKVLIPS